MSTESSPPSEDFYMFCTTTTENPSNLKLYVEDKLTSIVIDSDTSCYLMSEVFKYVTDGKVNLSKCDKKKCMPMHLRNRST